MKAHRAARLRELLRHLSEDEEEARRIYMRKTGYTKGRVTQQLAGFGERAGITIAGKLKLPDPRWFERELGTPRDAPPPMQNMLFATEGDQVAKLPRERASWPLPSVPPHIWAKLPPDRKREIDVFAAGVARGYGFGAPADSLGESPKSAG